VKAFQKEAKRENTSAKVYTADLKPELSAACNISDQAFKVPKASDPGYIVSLLNICRRNDIDIIIPTIDTELPFLAKSKESFKKQEIEVVISSAFFVEICRDKRKTSEYFQNLGISTPVIYKPNQIKFPTYVKPYNGSSSQKNKLIRSENELSNSIINNDDLLFCEYLDHEDYNEYTLDLYYSKGFNLKCVVPRKRIRVRGGEVSKGLTVKNKLVDFVKSRMMSLNGACGCLTLQLFLNEQNGNIKGIELNPRFGGGYPLSYLAGANYPKFIIEEYVFNREIEFNDEWEENLLMLRYDDEVLVHNYEG
jgi:carbamoyl-phosphate synthase large subunit